MWLNCCRSSPSFLFVRRWRLLRSNCPKMLSMPMEFGIPPKVALTNRTKCCSSNSLLVLPFLFSSKFASGALAKLYTAVNANRHGSRHDSSPLLPAPLHSFTDRDLIKFCWVYFRTKVLNGFGWNSHWSSWERNSSVWYKTSLKAIGHLRPSQHFLFDDGI